MQMITDFFKMLSQLFTITSRTLKPIELLVDQTATNLYLSNKETKIKAAATLRTLMSDTDVTQEELDQLDKDLWG